MVMADFEFIFALFGLLLGLSLVEVLGGLARSIEARLRPGSKVRIGWLTPLLGAFVLLDLLSFWQAAWVVRDVVAVSGRSLLAITAFTGAYYLASHLVFPPDPVAQGDFDRHFMRVRRIVIGVMLVLLLCQVGWYLTLPELAVHLSRPIAWIMTVVLAALMISAMVVRSERWLRILMVALVARYLVIYLI